MFVTQPIPSGTITWVQDPLDQVLEEHEISRLGKPYKSVIERFTWRNCEGRRILCWDFGRYMNHSCEANTFSAGPMFEIAVRDIETGEQLTSDYGALNIERPMACQCGSPRCRGIIRKDDFMRLAGEWDAKIQQAFPRIRNVDQPLWAYLPERRTIEKGIANPAKVPSILYHHFDPRRQPQPAIRRHGAL